MKLFYYPHCNGTAVCTVQSTDSSLTVLTISRLYCIFFYLHTAYVLKFIVLAAREIKSTAEGGKKLIKGIYFKMKLRCQQELGFFV